MPDELPTYLLGDTIRLELAIEHEVNLKDVWANFRRRGAAEGPSEFGIFLKEIALDRWLVERRRSKAILEKLVQRSGPPAGEYQLVDVRGLPYSAKDRYESNVLEFDAPADMSLRIAETSAITTPEVTVMKFNISPPE